MTTDQQQRLQIAGQVTSGIVHDLNNQLMLILNHLEFALQDLPANGILHQDLSDVRLAAERCTALIDSLLNFGKPSLKKLLPTDLTKLLTETGRLLRLAIPARVQLVLTAEPSALPIDADPAQLQQVIINLAMNARDAMPDGGKLEIEASNCSDSVRLTVRDSGCGMTRAIQKRMFEPYFTTKQATFSTGLGLSIVADIVRRHGARISAESSPGNGSCFQILFPSSGSWPQNEGSVHPHPWN